ncbi:MAG: hypothetical protein IT371_23030 [Deltaproteobacteria bacterium]|nr:hypothetical protein [Deltaproteobacteria bacterium]
MSRLALASLLAALAALGCASEAEGGGQAGPETCAICAISRYGCGQSAGESFYMQVSYVTEEGCRGTGAGQLPTSDPSIRIDCATSEACYSNGTCGVITVDAGTLRWTWGDGGIETTCRP